MFDLFAEKQVPQTIRTNRFRFPILFSIENHLFLEPSLLVKIDDLVKFNPLLVKRVAAKNEEESEIKYAEFKMDELETVLSEYEEDS